MATHRVTPPWHYLHEASDTSLESFELSRLNHAANLRKEIAALLEQWIEVSCRSFLGPLGPRRSQAALAAGPGV